MNTVYSVNDAGGHELIINIQTHLSNGLPGIQLIGVVGKSLDESKERIRSAFATANITLPRKKIIINFSPSDIPKDGAHYDLAIAISILLESKQINKLDERLIILGELSLDGEIKPIRGILGKILVAKKMGFNKFIIPKGNEQQAKLIPDIDLLCVDSLKKLKTMFDKKLLEYYPTKNGLDIKNASIINETDFSEIIGQNLAKRALEIAAAGQHNVLLSGPPGVGKSMLAKALISIMPPLNRNEVIMITHLHSLVGSDSAQLVTSRPIRMPHHSSSDVAIIGGGQKPKPGEITLSHKGILFLDELPEFKRSTIESLRQPLEDKKVTVSRAKDTITYPADFLLVATKNPCPCGYYGSAKPCICTPLEIERYRKKLSGPLLDRIDIHVTVDNVDHKKLLNNSADKVSSEQIKKRVFNALDKSKSRNIDGFRNGTMTNKEVKKFAKLSPEAKDYLDNAAKKLDISARVYMKTVKVARTIADLENSETIEPNHIAEALRYRPVETI